MKGGISESATQRIDRLLDLNQDLQADKVRLTRRVKELEEQVSKLQSDAGWSREFYEQQAIDNNNGWK